MNNLPKVAAQQRATGSRSSDLSISRPCAIISPARHLRVSSQLLDSFYSAPQASSASAVYATANPSVRLSVCHTPVFCQNDGTQRDAVFTFG